MANSSGLMEHPIKAITLQTRKKAGEPSSGQINVFMKENGLEANNPARVSLQLLTEGPSTVSGCRESVRNGFEKKSGKR